MLDYLHNAGYIKTYNEFREEAPELVGLYTDCVRSCVLIKHMLKHDFTPDSTSPTSGLLVKKWTSIIRMQRRVCHSLPFFGYNIFNFFTSTQIMELEKQLKQALEDISNANPLASGNSNRANKEWIPSTTPRHTLTGHRDKINAVSFHPLYSVLASASVDATVKIWDWDTGECERTLKSHTKAVSDCQYDSTGKVLGGYQLAMSPKMTDGALLFINSNLFRRSLHQTLECPRRLQELCYIARS